MAINLALLSCFNRVEARSAIRPLATCRTLHFFFPFRLRHHLSLEPRTEYALPHQVVLIIMAVVSFWFIRQVNTTTSPRTNNFLLPLVSAHDRTLSRTLTTSSRTSAERTSHLLSSSSSLLFSLLQWPHTFVTSLADRVQLLLGTERPSLVDGQSQFRPQRLTTSTQRLRGTRPRLFQGHH